MSYRPSQYQVVRFARYGVFAAAPLFVAAILTLRGGHVWPARGLMIGAVASYMVGMVSNEFHRRIRFWRALRCKCGANYDIRNTSECTVRVQSPYSSAKPRSCVVLTCRQCSRQLVWDDLYYPAPPLSGGTPS